MGPSKRKRKAAAPHLPEAAAALLLERRVLGAAAPHALPHRVGLVAGSVRVDCAAHRVCCAGGCWPTDSAAGKALPAARPPRPRCTGQPARCGRGRELNSTIDAAPRARRAAHRRPCPWARAMGRTLWGWTRCARSGAPRGRASCRQSCGAAGCAAVGMERANERDGGNGCRDCGFWADVGSSGERLPGLAEASRCPGARPTHVILAPRAPPPRRAHRWWQSRSRDRPAASMPRCRCKKLPVCGVASERRRQSAGTDPCGSSLAVSLGGGGWGFVLAGVPRLC